MKFCQNVTTSGLYDIKCGFVTLQVFHLYRDF